jgi:hypothetical protein
MNILFEANGMEEASAAMQKINSFLASRSPRGVRLHGKTRNENASLTNDDVLRFLKEQGRTAGEKTDADDKIIAQAFEREAERRLDLLNTAAAENVEGVARAARAAAFMAAGKAFTDIIRQRLENSLNADGSKAANVSEKYAEWRAKKYGMPADPSVVYRASGQLLSNIDKTNLRIFK